MRTPPSQDSWVKSFAKKKILAPWVKRTQPPAAAAEDHACQ